VRCSTSVKIRTALIPQKDGTWQLIPGLYKNLFPHFSKKFNMTFIYQPAIGGSTGSKLPNGTWIGTVS
jgi:hypothetical protein